MPQTRKVPSRKLPSKFSSKVLSKSKQTKRPVKIVQVHFTKENTDLQSETLPKLSHKKKDEVKDLILSKKAAKCEVYTRHHEICEEKDLKVPLILIMATDFNGSRELLDRDLLYKLLEGCMILNARAVVIDNTEPPEHFEYIDKPITWLNAQTDLAPDNSGSKKLDRLFLAADMAVTFHPEMDVLKLLMGYGIVLVGEEKSPLLQNYHPNHETGNSFTFEKKDPWSIFATIVRATETYRFPYDWQNIIRNGLK